MGSVYKRADSPFWHIKWTVPGVKKPFQKKTPFRKDDPAGEGEARKALAIIEAKIRAQAREAGGGKVLTVGIYSGHWIGRLRRRGIKTADKYEQRARDYIIPTLGDLELAAVSTADVRSFVSETLPATGLAPRSQHHVFQQLSQMFADAESRDLITKNPCRIPKHEKPRRIDADPLWRARAVFSRAEVELLISSKDICEHQRTLWAILFLTGMRIGEALALRWDRYDPQTPNLGTLTVASSWDSKIRKEGPTKTKTARAVPVHPTLARILAQWQLGGWARFIGRHPRPDDLIIPSFRGTFWNATTSYQRFQADLEELNLRARRQHDTRRTFISLAIADGASRDLLRWVTHGPEGDVMSSYTTPPWDALCESVSKLKIGILAGKLVALPSAVGDTATASLRSSQDREIAGKSGEGRGPSTASDGFQRASFVAPSHSERESSSSDFPRSAGDHRSHEATEEDPGGYVERARRSGLSVVPPARRGGRS